MIILYGHENVNIMAMKIDIFMAMKIPLVYPLH
jgi:hypothetical protein